MDAGAALTATAFPFDLAARAAYVDAGIVDNTGYDRPGLQDAHIPRAAAFNQLLCGPIETIAK